MQIIQIVSSISELGVSFKFQLNVASYYQLIHVLIHDFDEDDRVKVTALPTLVHVSSIHRTSCSSQKFWKRPIVREPGGRTRHVSLWKILPIHLIPRLFRI